MEKEILNQEMQERLLAYFNGELEEAEESVVKEWLKDKPENLELYRQLVKDCLFIRWARKEQEVDIKKRKAMFLSQLHRTKVRKMWYGVAASVVALVIMGGLYLTTGSYPDEKTLAKNEQRIHPGYPQAKLILSTGEEIDLAQNKENIKEQDGSFVRIDSNKGIVYNTTQMADASKPIYNKIIVPRGGEFFVTLSDGTRIWLNAESELEYPVKFTTDKREVKLKGEAYFSVVKDTEKPFIVSSGEYSLRVYGTEFNLNTYHKEEIQAVLVEGSIGFRANRKTPEQRLKPDQLGVANVITGKVEIKDVDVYPYIAWRKQDMVFVNEPLESIMEKAARWYDVKIFFQNESLKNVRFYGNMQRYADIQELLFFLENTSNVSFTVKDKTVVINNK